MNPNLFHLNESCDTKKLINNNWLLKSYYHTKKYEKDHPEKAKQIREKVQNEFKERNKNGNITSLMLKHNKLYLP